MSTPTDRQHPDDPAREALNRKPSDADLDKNQLKQEAEEGKATQFDGNPNVEKVPDGPFGPKDDTPWKLEKKG